MTGCWENCNEVLQWARESGLNSEPKVKWGFTSKQQGGGQWIEKLPKGINMDVDLDNVT